MNQRNGLDIECYIRSLLHIPVWFRHSVLTSAVNQMTQLKLVTLCHEPPSNEHYGQMNSVAMVAERGPT